jgi:2-succinyl-5-enolpyruvyl-6-hydroxy-3-cyclohexene-1-carboxylate synthase
MYTSLLNVQIILSLLKQHNIRYLVLSPGTRNTPLVHSVETDNFFKCFSIVDERSAAYFALGLSTSTGEPVCFCCTSSTAACNYLPAIKEAYENQISLIALTADRDFRLLYQMEDQMIDQANMYKGYIKCSVNLPVVKNNNDVWYCVRKVNEAILELNHHGVGPVQINFQVDELGDFSVKDLPVYRKIVRIDDFQSKDIWKIYKERLSSKKRILVLCGESYGNSNELRALLEKFIDKYNAVISYDYFSNITSDKFLKTLMICESVDYYEYDNLTPDLVITIGGQVYYSIKNFLRDTSRHFEHWRIALDGEIVDGFKALTNVFECEPEMFLKNVTEDVSSNNNNQYYQLWKTRIDSVKYPELQFTNFSVIRDLTRLIPDNSLIHTSILNSTRITNFWKLEKNVRCFSNLGADGIDGALSTFFGQSDAENRLSFLIIGDLSFIYDLNSTLLQLKKHQRILVINNFAGGEFHTNFGTDYISTLNQHIAAGHHSKVSDWISMMNVKYLSAANQSELDENMKIFISESEQPIIFEVFTDANTDSKVLKAFYIMNRILTPKIFMKKCINKIRKKLIMTARVWGYNYED